MIRSHRNRLMYLLRIRAMVNVFGATSTTDGVLLA